MNQAQMILTFMIVAFSFAIIIIWQRESIPERARRPLAIFAIFLVVCAFVLMMISFFI
jgi:hypothetical protein